MSWLVAGLGNPGTEFAESRHNIGGMVVGTLARRAGERWRKVRFLPVESAGLRGDPEPIVLARSLRYMNDSGPSYASLAKKLGVAADHVIAVHDDIDLAFGALRVKMGGSAAGHNGLRSLESALRTPEFYRVRIGVGRPPGRQDPADYVLERFAARERDEVAILIEEAAGAVLSLVRDGLEKTQNAFSRPGT